MVSVPLFLRTRNYIFFVWLNRKFLYLLNVCLKLNVVILTIFHSKYYKKIIRCLPILQTVNWNENAILLEFSNIFTFFSFRSFWKSSCLGGWIFNLIKYTIIKYNNSLIVKQNNFRWGAWKYSFCFIRGRGSYISFL